MYSQDKIDVALKVFHQCGSVTTTIRVLGYPTRRALCTWIANEGSGKSERKPLKLVNTAEHPLCEKCREAGRLTNAEKVHHIKPLSKGGTHAENNLMALCKRCHSEITAREGGRWG